jgi:hypothetical protein
MERQMRGSMVESDGDSFEEREVDNSGWHLHIIIYFVFHSGSYPVSLSGPVSRILQLTHTYGCQSPLKFNWFLFKVY